MTGEREDTEVAGRDTVRRNGRVVVVAQEDVGTRSTGQRERAIKFLRLAA